MSNDLHHLKKEKFSKVQSVLSQRRIRLIHLSDDLPSVLIAVAKDMRKLIVGNWLVSQTGGKSVLINKKIEVLRVTEDVVLQVLIEGEVVDQKLTMLMRRLLMIRVFQYSQKSN